jgi:hypothetical protein
MVMVLVMVMVMVMVMVLVGVLVLGFLLLVVLVVVGLMLLVVFVSQVFFAPSYAHFFLTPSTDYTSYAHFFAGETHFTHATQDSDHGQPSSQRTTFGPTDYNTPQYSSSSYGDTSPYNQYYPVPDVRTQAPMQWVFEWEDPHFYEMLVTEWETTAAWTGQSWQDFKSELLSRRGINLMSLEEYTEATRMGIFPYFTQRRGE